MSTGRAAQERVQSVALEGTRARPPINLIDESLRSSMQCQLLLPTNSTPAEATKLGNAPTRYPSPAHDDKDGDDCGPLHLGVVLPLSSEDEEPDHPSAGVNDTSTGPFLSTKRPRYADHSPATCGHTAPKRAFGEHSICTTPFEQCRYGWGRAAPVSCCSCSMLSSFSS